jgi:DNA-directed RNA polymerase subunit M/transcription elongation factor TFIIS
MSNNSAASSPPDLSRPHCLMGGVAYSLRSSSLRRFLLPSSNGPGLSPLASFRARSRTVGGAYNLRPAPRSHSRRRSSNGRASSREALSASFPRDGVVSNLTKDQVRPSRSQISNSPVCTHRKEMYQLLQRRTDGRVSNSIPGWRHRSRQPINNGPHSNRSGLSP